MITVSSGATLAVLAGASTGQWAAADIDTLQTDATFNSGSFLGIDTTGGDFAYSSVITGSLGLTKLGSNTLTITGSNTFTGAVNFNGGLIKAATLNKLGAGSKLNFNGGGLQFDGVFDPSSSTMTFQSGGAILDTQTNNITMANSIGNGGAGGLTKNGSGMLILSKSPNYNGATVVNAGTLQLGSGAILPSATTVNLTASGATLDINANSQTIASLTGVAGTEVKLGGGTLTVANSVSTIFAGAITSSSSGSLTKTGTGTLELDGKVSYSGNTTINAGVLKINNNLSTTLSAISGNGTLEVDGSSSVLTAGSITANTLTIGAGAEVVIAAISGSGIKLEASIEPVPEPGALTLLGIAALATLFVAWRRKQ
jgi:autotransporter-associated beta strand protein